MIHPSDSNRQNLINNFNNNSTSLSSNNTLSNQSRKIPSSLLPTTLLNTHSVTQLKITEAQTKEVQENPIKKTFKSLLAKLKLFFQRIKNIFSKNKKPLPDSNTQTAQITDARNQNKDESSQALKTNGTKTHQPENQQVNSDVPVLIMKPIYDQPLEKNNVKTTIPVTKKEDEIDDPKTSENSSSKKVISPITPSAQPTIAKKIQHEEFMPQPTLKPSTPVPAIPEKTLIKPDASAQVEPFVPPMKDAPQNASTQVEPLAPPIKDALQENPSSDVPTAPPVPESLNSSNKKPLVVKPKVENSQNKNASDSSNLPVRDQENAPLEIPASDVPPPPPPPPLPESLNPSNKKPFVIKPKGGDNQKQGLNSPSHPPVKDHGNNYVTVQSIEKF